MLRILCVSLWMIIPAICCMGQELYYFGANNRPLNTEEGARFIQEVHKKSEKNFLLKKSVKSGRTWSEAIYQKITVIDEGKLRIRTRGKGILQKRLFRQMIPAGKGMYAFEETVNGILLRSGSTSRYLPLMLEGTVKEYHPNGMEKSVSIFQNNQLISNKNWLQDGSSYIDSIYFSTDRAPIYRPGDKSFKNHLIKGIAEAKLDLDEYDDDVIIGWVVMETGQIEGVIALQGKSNFLNQTLVDIIAETPGDWEPAYLDGNPVRYFMTIPITISHSGAKFQDLEFSMGMLHYNSY